MFVCSSSIQDISETCWWRHVKLLHHHQYLYWVATKQLWGRWWVLWFSMLCYCAMPPSRIHVWRKVLNIVVVVISSRHCISIIIDSFICLLTCTEPLEGSAWLMQESYVWWNEWSLIKIYLYCQTVISREMLSTSSVWGPLYCAITEESPIPLVMLDICISYTSYIQQQTYQSVVTKIQPADWHVSKRTISDYKTVLYHTKNQPNSHHGFMSVSSVCHCFFVILLDIERDLDINYSTNLLGLGPRSL